jgi:hypothetical protein
MNITSVDTKPQYIRLRQGVTVRNGNTLVESSIDDPAELYRALNCNYPKFFKMDLLSKWAWLGAEALLKDVNETAAYDEADRNKTAIVIATTNGCLDVDRRFAETLRTVPSPALFVYTLPNIMLGEISIRHGFKGEQLCEVQEYFDTTKMLLWVEDLFQNHDTTHCLFGWADAVDGYHDVCLFWANADNIHELTPDALQSILELK